MLNKRWSRSGTATADCRKAGECFDKTPTCFTYHLHTSTQRAGEAIKYSWKYCDNKQIQPLQQNTSSYNQIWVALRRMSWRNSKHPTYTLNNQAQTSWEFHRHSECRFNVFSDVFGYVWVFVFLKQWLRQQHGWIKKKSKSQPLSRQVVELPVS